MTNPLESPREPDTKKSRHFFLGVTLLLIAVMMPILGMAGTIAGMVYAFNELSEGEAASPESLADAISFSLVTTIVGVIVGVVAAILGGVLIVVARRRDRRSAT